MPAQTPIYALPYPLGTDKVQQGDNDIQALALRVEALLGTAIGVPSGRRNVIRNGDLGVSQRGNGPVTTGGYLVDGWQAGGSGGTRTQQRYGTAPGTFDAPFGVRLDVAGQAAAGDYMQYTHAIEGVRTLAGRQVTLSFLAQAGAGTPKLGIEVEQSFGGGGGSASVRTFVQAITLSAVFVRYVVTFTLPAITGKTIGSAGNDCVYLNFWLSAGTDFAARLPGIGIQAATFYLTDLQLEAGPAATPFERLSQQAQLSWCQRYFYRIAPPINTIIGFGFCYSTSVAVAGIQHPVPMRAVPTLTVTTPGGFMIVMANGAANGSGTVGMGGTPQLPTEKFAMVATSQSGVNAGAPCTFGTHNAFAGGTLDFSAEI